MKWKLLWKNGTGDNLKPSDSLQKVQMRLAPSKELRSSVAQAVMKPIPPTELVEPLLITERVHLPQL